MKIFLKLLSRLLDEVRKHKQIISRSFIQSNKNFRFQVDNKHFFSLISYYFVQEKQMEMKIKTQINS